MRMKPVQTFAKSSNASEHCEPAVTARLTNNALVLGHRLAFFGMQVRS